mmetsp:Transcript_28048/g.27061  ORF Transcript_28048/g.27061 Transcript_28048/m.27061 type:complete len:82 (+) Transcript_28048:553-798(+)|eukprot:CAMPEP_0170565514 /NCGR_PEP_ID=MMETSP0211-20121228/79237_1 /TAXON_ID=311385 /ORGANISM="Pseudokeronopsis sp., Strain OXSARD2" /LENGTH=81 /DNA_ID=CAMNT_0010886403 /DNA_START=677 /DNA_END=922 /DNA_ORIENTATION=-
MEDLNQLAKDIHEETKFQGEKVHRIDEEMTTGLVNVEGAESELSESHNRQKNKGRCTYFMLMLILVSVGITMGVLGIKYYN